jgi:hypothetical protein
MNGGIKYMGENNSCCFCASTNAFNSQYGVMCLPCAETFGKIIETHFAPGKKNPAGFTPSYNAESFAAEEICLACNGANKDPETHGYCENCRVKCEICGELLDEDTEGENYDNENCGSCYVEAGIIPEWMGHSYYHKDYLIDFPPKVLEEYGYDNPCDCGDEDECEHCAYEWKAESYSAEKEEVFKCNCGGNLMIEEVLFVECDQCGATDYQAESYVDFFSQIEELLDSTAKDGNWMLDATTDPKDPDSVTMAVTFTPKDPSTFFDIIE